MRLVASRKSQNGNRVINTKSQFTCFYNTQKQIVLPKQFLVVEDSFLPEKVKLEMSISVKRQFMLNKRRDGGDEGGETEATATSRRRDEGSEREAVKAATRTRQGRDRNETEAGISVEGWIRNIKLCY
ncbi:hypothetical protein YC2023_118986 [Brassica napus]